MCFRLFSQQAIVGLIFDRHRTTVGKVLTRWATKWALVGQDLCCLDITRDYLGKEVPNINLGLGKPKVVFHDGKNWLICPKHNNNAIMKCTYSSKNEHDATCGITWSTASGLCLKQHICLVDKLVSAPWFDCIVCWATSVHRLNSGRMWH